MGRAAFVCLIALLGLIDVGLCDVTKYDRRASRRDAGHIPRDSRKDTHIAGATRKDTRPTRKDAHTAAGSHGARHNDGRHFAALHARHDKSKVGRTDRFRLRDGESAECPEVPADYLFYPGWDSNGNDIDYLGPLDVADLAAACNEDPDCYGFNSNGWIKHTIVSEDEWVTWTDEPCLGLYVYAPSEEDSRRADRSHAERTRTDRSHAERSRVKDTARGDTECSCTREFIPVCGEDGKTYGNACEAGCANVAWVEGECPPPPAECPEVPADYLFYPGVDSNGNDIEYLGPLDVPDLAAACDEDPDCYGFNSNGWIKHTIVSEDEWVTWTDEPCLGLYVYAPSEEDSRGDRYGKVNRRDRQVSRRDGKFNRRDGKFSRRNRDHTSIRHDRKFIGHDSNHMG